VHKLVSALGSPLNIIFPERLRETISEFERVLREEALNGSVLYTTKPNRSEGLVREVALAGSSVDVSSSGAIAAALAAGITGKRIHASGPKDIEYLTLALQHSATICIDSFDELELLQRVSARLQCQEKPRIMVRLSGFTAGTKSLSTDASVFGIPLTCSEELLDRLYSLRESIELCGFSHHLPLPSNRERVVALEGTLKVYIAAQRRGLRPRVINIGGGFKISYAASLAEWQRFQSYLKASLLGQVKPVTWNGSGLGYRISDKGIVGSPNFQEHFEGLSGAAQLRSILREKMPSFDNASVGRVLQDLLVHLEVEPGRAILDQAGISIGRVMGSKENARGEILISLEMNHSNLRSNEQKLLTQPLCIPRTKREPDSRGIYLVGNLCIPNDLIQYQKVYPGVRVERGDLFVFMNTAPYLMDFVESSVLHQPTARKVIACKTRDQLEWEWTLDGEYSPIRRILEEAQ
jgi:diaminopimelate decarboxylase